QRHRGLRNSLELDELRDPSRPFSEDAQDLHFGAGDLAAAYLLDEQSHKDGGTRGQVLGEVVELLCALGLRHDAHLRHIADYIVICYTCQGSCYRAPLTRKERIMFENILVTIDGSPDS